MPAKNVEFGRQYEAVMKAMTSRGLLLGSYDAAGKANLMTIGWGSLGSMWGMPIWSVLVRPSRHTYRCIEHTGCFTVNVPTEAMRSCCGICGSKSGRDVNKFDLCNLTEERAKTVLAPSVAQCPIVYECRVVHSSDLLPEKLADEILGGLYVDGDFHRVYFGRILEMRVDEDAARLLGG